MHSSAMKHVFEALNLIGLAMNRPNCTVVLVLPILQPGCVRVLRTWEILRFHISLRLDTTHYSFILHSSFSVSRSSVVNSII